MAVERLREVLQPLIKVLLAVMDHLAAQSEAVLAAAVLDKSGQIRHPMLAATAVMVLRRQ